MRIGMNAGGSFGERDRESHDSEKLKWKFNGHGRKEKIALNENAEPKRAIETEAQSWTRDALPSILRDREFSGQRFRALGKREERFNDSRERSQRAPTRRSSGFIPKA